MEETNKFKSNLEVRHAKMAPTDLVGQEVNARFMDKTTFDRLVENIKTDGVLTGAITCYQPGGEGPVEILSGHHRCKAAIEAGITEVDVIIILTELSHDRKVAIQLSHNAVEGEDDLSVLSTMYLDLDLDAKRFSGLTDDDFGALGDVDISGLSVGGIKYQDVTLSFLPDDFDEFKNALSRMKMPPSRQFLIGRYDDFAAVFDALINVKESTNVYNNAVAFSVMAELALERLEQIKAEHKDEPEEADSDPNEEPANADVETEGE